MTTNPSRRPAAAGCDAVVATPSAQAVAWLALVALAIVGRLWRPEWNGEPLWNATPMAAVALAAGAIFHQRLLALSVPVAALLLGHLALPAYGSWTMAAVVVAATAWPVVLGGLLRGTPSAWRHWCQVAGGAVASSLVFFLVTNFAHWALRSDYPHTASGLAACFVAALPFYRWLPVGDVAWSLVVFGGLAAVGGLVGSLQATAHRTAAVAVPARRPGRDDAGRPLPLD